MSNSLLKDPPNFPYIQSPVDDLWSTFYVALWAVLNNTHTEYSDIERTWQVNLASGSALRALAVSELLDWSLVLQDISPILQQSTGILSDLHGKLVGIQRVWITRMKTYREAQGNADERRRIWRKLTLEGFHDFIQVFSTHWEALKEAGKPASQT